MEEVKQTKNEMPVGHTSGEREQGGPCREGRIVILQKSKACGKIFQPGGKKETRINEKRAKS